jgi:phage terminase large subunit-like protein
VNDDTSPVARGLAYAQMIAEGGRPASQWTRKACERHLRDLERAERGEGDFEFDESAGNAACDFVGLLPHVKGKWAAAHESISLEPWQCWVLSCLFGWKHRETGLRRFRTAYISVPRKNGKSTIGAGIGLYLMAADGEPGAEIYAAATKRDQARIIFQESQRMVRQSPDLKPIVLAVKDNLSVW